MNGVPGGGLRLRDCVSKENTDGNAETCVHVDVGLEGEARTHYRVAPASGVPIECQLDISDRPSLHTLNIGVIHGAVRQKRPSRPIVEVCPERERRVLKLGLRLGRISTGPTSKEEWVLGSVDDTFDDHDPFLPALSLQRELGGVSGGRVDLVRELRLSVPCTVVEDRGGLSPTLQLRGWDADDEGEESGKDEQRRQQTHFVGGSGGLV